MIPQRHGKVQWVMGMCSVLLAIVGCGTPKAYVFPGLNSTPPKRVAVLPFVLTHPQDTSEMDRLGRDIFRKTFYHAFATYGYEDVKLSEVDQRLTASWGPLENGAWRDVPVGVLTKTLEVDAVVYGDIHNVVRFSTPLYTQTSLDATLKIERTSLLHVLRDHLCLSSKHRHIVELNILLFRSVLVLPSSVSGKSE